jgi:hypothetical protein
MAEETDRRPSRELSLTVRQVIRGPVRTSEVHQSARRIFGRIAVHDESLLRSARRLSGEGPRQSP